MRILVTSLILIVLLVLRIGDGFIHQPQCVQQAGNGLGEQTLVFQAVAELIQAGAATLSF